MKSIYSQSRDVRVFTFYMIAVGGNLLTEHQNDASNIVLSLNLFRQTKRE